MSAEGMDPNSEILEQEAAPRVEAEPGTVSGARDWPGVSRESEPAPVKFPGEDGGKSLARMAERDLMAAVQLLAERAQYITGATGAAIALRDGDEMVCRASAGGSAPEIGARLQMDSGLSGESIRTRQLLRCNDAQTDGRVNRESCEALGIASVVVMPMLDGGEVIGVFELFSDRAYAFEDRDIVALERMGAMVRTALEQAEGGMASGEGHADEEPVLADESAGKESEELAATFAPPEDIADGVAEPTFEAAAQDVQTVDGALFVEQTNELVDESPFLSVPENSVEAHASAAPEKSADPAEASDPDVGEMARDAAARTEAWKASLFASDKPEASATPVASETPGRIAFHMRVPRKTEAQPFEAGIPPAQASVVVESQQAESEKAESRKKDDWETPAFQSENEEPLTNAATGETAGIAGSTALTEILQQAGEQSQTPDEVALPGVDRASPAAVASTGSAAAAAPAREARAGQAAPGPTFEEKARGVPATLPVNPIPEQEAPKPKIEIARPASSEGRAKIAVAQVRKCEACGFPVSEGRKLCLDCEKKPQKAETSAKPTAVAVPTVAANVKNDVGAATPAEQVSATLINKAPVASLSETVGAAATPAEGEKAEQKPEMKRSEASPAAHVAAAEPPAPQFMVSAPDHYESWIVSHMYTAVAIAVIAVGIVVYLLSR
jgi:putative methionine-R-sulfoxide reductase with GAF domain